MARRLCATLGSLLLPLNIASLGVPKKLLPINFHDMTFDILFVIPILICLAAEVATKDTTYITKVAFDHKFDRDEPDGHTLSMARAKQK